MARKRTPNRLRWFVVWLANLTDSRDDEPVRVKARTKTAAEAEAIDGRETRFCIRNTYDGMRAFYKDYPDWKGLI